MFVLASIVDSVRDLLFCRFKFVFFFEEMSNNFLSTRRRWLCSCPGTRSAALRSQWRGSSEALPERIWPGAGLRGRTGSKHFVLLSRSGSAAGDRNCNGIAIPLLLVLPSNQFLNERDLFEMFTKLVVPRNFLFFVYFIPRTCHAQPFIWL